MFSPLRLRRSKRDSLESGRAFLTNLVVGQQAVVGFAGQHGGLTGENALTAEGAQNLACLRIDGVAHDISNAVRFCGASGRSTQFSIVLVRLADVFAAEVRIIVLAHLRVDIARKCHRADECVIACGRLTVTFAHTERVIGTLTGQTRGTYEHGRKEGRTRERRE